MSLKRREKMLVRYSYDFDRDGGGQGDIDLVAEPNELEVGLRVVNAYVIVEEALTSAGSPSVTIGDADDRDGYFQDCFALLDGDEEGCMAGEVAGDYLFDDTNDHLKMMKIESANLAPSMSIGTADLTAGKFSVYLEVIKQ